MNSDITFLHASSIYDFRKLSELTGKFRPLSYVAIFQRVRGILISIINEINASFNKTVIIDSSD
ncbi:MAG: hypothetical protein QW292_04315 [Candidatus Parvarchaeota archaeon]